MKISIQIIYLASIKEQVNKEDEWIEVEINKKLNDIINQIILNYPQVEEFKKNTFLIALNMDIINKNKNLKLKDKDQIAFLPPVTGG